MDTNEVTLWVQAGAVVVAVAASVVALVVSALDRKNSRQIAAADRRAALELSQLLFQQESIVKLAQTLKLARNSDTDVRGSLLDEAEALIYAVGPELLPRNWAKVSTRTDSRKQELIEGDSVNPEFQRLLEVQLALTGLMNQIRKQMVVKDGI
ncbi:hypothetical protein ABIB48_002663 [Arthrobacter sp. UYCu511]|uniref:hypothetical protein n=1 Tax=Arthrobacter sp. UYCu511 TaxID=3156337 RepID=UPI003396E3A3